MGSGPLKNALEGLAALCYTAVVFCNFCGKNFDSTEGFEEISRAGHHYLRCEKCVQCNTEDEYDWHREMYGLAKGQGRRGGQTK